LQSTTSLGSCKFNGEGYTCNNLLLTHPSHHTVENIQADAEVVAFFTNPTGKLLCVSSLVRVNPSETPSSQFFNAFVGYANPSVQYTPVNLGDNWGLFMMVPPAGAYYVYDGSLVVPPCQSTTWVVFKSMINIDSNNFALLVKNVSPGSRPIQALGDREVFFNDVQQLPGGPMPHDNKAYMRCRRVAKKGETKPVQRAPLGEKVDKPGILTHIHKFTSKQIERNGVLALFDVVLMLLSLVLGVYYGYQFGTDVKYTQYSLKPILWLQGFASWIKSKISKPKPIIYTSSSSQA